MKNWNFFGIGDPVFPKTTEWCRKHTLLIQGPKDQAPHPYSIEEFEEVAGVRYFSGLGFNSKRTRRLVERQCQAAVASQTLKTEVKWLGACFAREIASGYINDVTVKWIDEHIGFGLYADRYIKKGEFIGEYTGLLKRYVPFWTNVNPYCYRYPSSQFGWRTFTIDAGLHGNEIRYINHSNHPNCESFVALHNGIFHMCIRAIQDIPIGTQLCYDYGNEYLRSEKPLPDVIA